MWPTISFSVSHPDREFVARDFGVALHSREYFSACNEVDLHHKARGDTFELCQAGYPDRKLFYDTRTA